jgi:hypothetical protein
MTNDFEHGAPKRRAVWSPQGFDAAGAMNNKISRGPTQ